MPLGSLNSPSCKGRSPDKSAVERSPTKRRFASRQCSAALQPIFRRCSRNVGLLFTLLDPPKVSSALSLIICMNIRLTRSFAISSMKSDCRQFGYESGVEADLIDAVDYLSRGSGNICAQQRIDADDYNVCCICPEVNWCQRWIARISAIPIVLTIDLHGLVSDW